MMFLPVIEPFIILQALVFAPLATGRVTLSYVVSVLAEALVIRFIICRKRAALVGGLRIYVTYVVFFSWQIYYALITLSTQQMGHAGTEDET